MHYVDWGNPEAPPLLMIHGGRDHCRNWDWVAQAMRDEYHIIAPDLRGHGDSDWMLGGNYNTLDYVYDIAQLLHQNTSGPVKIIAHSMGGSVALTYSGLFPEKVSKLVVIEGMGPSPAMLEKTQGPGIEERVTDWVAGMRKLSGRLPRRYPNLDEALSRMQGENPHLSAEQAHHLTVHGSIRNEDGTYSWKFDNYVRSFSPTRMPPEEVFELYQRIDCPTLLFRGTESWASDPEKDGRMAHFKDARLENIDNAGHWVHHDQLDRFMHLTTEFLQD